MNDLPDDARFVEQAIALALQNVHVGGRPFGALVVRAGQVVGMGVNTVESSGDVVAHAEVEALRTASKVVGAEMLPGAVVVSSCEPCPMCMAAAALMGVERIVYAASKEDAERSGFLLGGLPAEMQALWRRSGPQRVERLAAGDPTAPFREYERRS